MGSTASSITSVCPRGSPETVLQIKQNLAVIQVASTQSCSQRSTEESVRLSSLLAVGLELFAVLAQAKETLNKKQTIKESKNSLINEKFFIFYL